MTDDASHPTVGSLVLTSQNRVVRVHRVPLLFGSQRLKSGDMLCRDGEVSDDMYSNTTAGTLVAAESG